MPHWLIKAALQRGISFLPNSHKWNELLQTRITKSIELTPERFEERLDFCRRHFENFTELRSTVGDKFTVVEVGTGWYPTVPVGLFLAGASEIWTYDIAPLLRSERVMKLLRMFDDYAVKGALRKIFPHALPERLTRLRQLILQAGNQSPESLLERIQIHPRVQDAQQTGLNPGTVDLVVSTGVLEYIPREVLRGMLREFRRVGTRGAVTSHYLNLIDQYWYFDRSITPFNFLKFPACRWKYFNSPMIWQNRLRISDFRELFAEAGFPIVKEASTSGSLEDLQKIRLAPEFQKYRQEDLLVLTSWIAARSVG